jgi:hypothetical protein
MMMAKVYSVHLMSVLGYDILFQDVDVVWYKNPLSFFESPQSGDFDIYFQDDGAHSARYAPYSPNTGLYFVSFWFCGHLEGLPEPTLHLTHSISFVPFILLAGPK